MTKKKKKTSEINWRKVKSKSMRWLMKLCHKTSNIWDHTQSWKVIVANSEYVNLVKTEIKNQSFYWLYQMVRFKVKEMTLLIESQR